MPINLDPTKPRAWTYIVLYWRHMRGPCARCGGIIDYDGPRYYRVLVGGEYKRKVNRWALDVGHIIEKDIDRRRLYAPIDTQPEHVYCNRSKGAQYGNRKRALLKMRNLRTSRQW